ncbi:hypothetical protein KZ855_30875, partial [Pseudomonas aeruginosa]|nr:hypothetical protein [Pseudomonas aeruginosa]
MSASEDLQSAVQPAASEALEGFPLSPLQTRAWRRHAERPENTVVGVRLHAPADPAATLELSLIHISEPTRLQLIS